MTGDLDPGRTQSDDLGVLFEHYLMTATGLAAERGYERVVPLLAELGRVKVGFAEFPVSSSADGQVRANVDVVVLGEVEGEVLDRVQEVLDEAASGDGFHVRSVRDQP